MRCYSKKPFNRPPGGLGGPCGVAVSFADGRKDELVALLPFVAGVPAGEERKKSGEDDATLFPFWFLRFLGVDILPTVND